MSRIIYLSDFHAEDVRAQFAAALEDAKNHPGTTLCVAPGEYVITSERARKTMREAISGVYGENPEKTMFSPDYAFTEGISFEGHSGTTLSAYGAKLMIDGFMEPVCLKNCENIRIEGLTIDHVRKPYSRGEIEEYSVEDAQARTGHIVVRFADAFPIDENTIMPRYCAYDFAEKRFNLDMRVLKRTCLGGQRVRFDMKNMPEKSLLRQEFYVWHSFHYRPGILIENAKAITLRDVTIHSQPGMGIVGHRSEDVLMERLKVVPSHGEHMSTNTDATHFTSCKGFITFRDCEFEGHGDDATNVHTFYHDIEMLSPNTYRGSVGVRTHSLTLDWPDAGDEMELVDKKSLSLRGKYRVVSVKPDFENETYVAELDAPLPEDAAETCWLSDVTRLPKLTFSGCTASNHWARSVLIKTRNAVVENCTFFGAVLYAIHIAAEGWWHEGVACENVVVRGNRFVNCGIGGHAKVGGVQVEMSVDERKGAPQKNIEIVNNVFDLAQVQHAVHVSNAANVKIAGNRFIGTEDPVEIVNCENVKIGENEMLPGR